MCQVPKFVDATVIKLGGRPTTYSQSIIQVICDRISKGKSLRQVCMTPGIPSKATVMRWLAAPANEDFRTQYQVACWIREMEMMDDILELADDTSRDSIHMASGKVRPNIVVIRRDKLRIKVRIWLISICSPKRYRPLCLE